MKDILKRKWKTLTLAVAGVVLYALGHHVIGVCFTAAAASID